MDPTPVAVVVDSGLSTWSLQEWLALLAAFAAFISVTLVPAVVTVVRELRANRNAQTAAAVVNATQQNRYLETRGAEPVTMSSPPTGTGSGGVDKAVTAILTEASPVPIPVAPRPAPDGELQRSLARLIELLERQAPPPAAGA